MPLSIEAESGPSAGGAGGGFYSLYHAARELLEFPYLNCIFRHICPPGLRGYIDASRVRFASTMTSVVRVVTRNFDAIFGGVHVNFRRDFAELPRFTDRGPKRTPRCTPAGRKYKLAVAHKHFMQFRTAEEASLAADILLAGTTTRPRLSFGRHFPLSGLALAVPDCLRQITAYTNPRVNKAGVTLGGAYDRVKVARDLAILVHNVLRACGLGDEGAVRDLKREWDSWRRKDAATKAAWKGREYRERANIAQGTTDDDALKRM